MHFPTLTSFVAYRRVSSAPLQWNDFKYTAVIHSQLNIHDSRKTLPFIAVLYSGVL